ncbi:probable disease resistance protein At1g58390 [Vitis vinifera]|uniref:probable disease resistance protein At1g58390 n=1 Tax=Vitis vinifera TaxID=29760 RepID=UPI00054036B1|nr:probable disease resistance protein At1g58390 [Vitis vinifera]|eukprot:XP_010661781.1 PREDICTED: probable disease resistance protein At1g58390 [Vitis vinifera]
MADTVSIFVEKLSNLVLQEAFLFGQVEEQVKLLRDELKWMRLFLKDADSQSLCNEKIKLWVEQIRNVTHDAEDVIDEFILDMDRRQLRLNTLKFLKCLPTCVGFADKLPFIHELDGRVKEINIRIERIMANRSKYGLEALMASNSSSTTDQVVAYKEKWAQVVEGSDVVGIEDGTEVVTQMLTKGEMRRAVVSIVGMGGLGKTTLAKKVYNHSGVKRHFDCIAWVCVSQEFKPRELLLSIISSVMSLSNEEKKEMREVELGGKLRECLNDKKYLVVMDDVWSIEAWSSLCSYLPESRNGSKVLMTTRNKEIAAQANGHEVVGHTDSQALVYELPIMDDDESWELFLKKTFGARDNTHVPSSKTLEELGRKIVAKCNGLPLAIVVLGGLLSTKERTEPSWERVLESIDWHLNRGPESCFGILALSYNDLPYYLKSCFLYCGIFPEDSEIKASKLIHLWIAEGFVQRRGIEKLEDIAEDYLYELIHRSMVQVARKKANGRVMSCRIHDLLRDLAISEARDAKLFEELRHLNCCYGEMSSQFKLNKCMNGYLGVEQLTNLQTLALPVGSWLEGDGLGKLTQLRKLRLVGPLAPYLKKGFFDSIAELTTLRTLFLGNWQVDKKKTLLNRVGLKWQENVVEEKTLLPGLMSFSRHTYLYKVHLYGKVDKLPEQTEFYPPNLLKLTLSKCELEDDPMLILEKLPTLRILGLLRGSYVGKKMVCSCGGFLQLESLELNGLNELEELTVEEGAMCNLRTLQILSCDKMKKFPHGLLQMKKLEKLGLIRTSGKLIEEVQQTEGEEWDRIRLITFIDK